MRGPLIGGKDFQLPFDKEAAQGGVLEGYQGGEEVSCFLGENKGKNGGVRKRLVLKYGKVLFMEKMCANKSMEGSCV